MSEQKTYDMEYDREEACQFCGRIYTGSDEEDYEEWWAPTECLHMCCSECAIYDEQDAPPVCPTCAKEDGLRRR